MSISRSNGSISNGVIIKNVYFVGNPHEREALEALRERENRNALIPDFGESFSIPSEYSLNENGNFNLFEREVTALNSVPANGYNNITNPDLQMPSDDSKTEIRDFFQEALENLDKIDIDHLSGLQELTAVILISKEYYEKHEEFTKELIDNLFKKIVEKLEIIKKPLYEYYLKKLEIKKMDINEDFQSYVKLVRENLEFVFTSDRSRYETFKSQCHTGYDQLRSRIYFEKKEIQRKIIQIINLDQHGNVLDFLNFLYERAYPYIPEKEAKEVIEFIYDYHVQNFKFI